MIYSEKQIPMRKAGIITIVDYNNLGNRLQNYATQEVIKSLGFGVVTIVNKPTVRENLITKLKRANIISIVRFMDRF